MAYKTPHDRELVHKIVTEYQKTNCTVTSLGEKYKICRHTISLWLKARNIKIKGGTYKSRMIEENIHKIISLYREGQSTCEIALQFNVSDECVRNQLLKRIALRHRKHNFDETFFDVVNTEEKAYILGHIYAEGNISDNEMRIKIHRDDIDVLIKSRECLKYTGPIRKVSNKNAVQMGICSIEFVQQLSKLGVMPDKAAKIVFPNFIDNELIIHFIRGFFDGDGWVSHRNNRYESIGMSTTSKSFAYSLLEWIRKNILLRDTGSMVVREKWKANPKWKTGYQLSFSRFDGIKILDKMYKGSSINLDRKRKLYYQALIDVNGYC